MLKTALIFQSGMVLQCKKPVPLWGDAEAGEKVCVSVQGKSAAACADADGKWYLKLPPLEVSESETLTITAGDENITYRDVAVGEVWIASGQSNMEYHMRYEKHINEEKRHCRNSRIRFFDVPEIAYVNQAKQFDYSRMGFWRSASEENLEYFSAVGYYFEKVVERELNVPVGIIGCNWGGTASSVWMAKESVERVGKPWMEEYEKAVDGMDMEDYWAGQASNPINDRGNPFADPFTELVMPRTVLKEEIERFFAAQDDSFFNYFSKMQANDIPGCLYEHMVKTIAPYGVRGVLWYQGESDDVAGRQLLYQDMLTALIADWRSLWEEEALPFLIVQLPGYERWLDSECMDFPTIRACQQKVADTVPDVYLCSISDAGEQYDIHPKNKLVVGERLAALGLGHIYGREGLCDAPVPDACTVDKRKVILHFKNADGGLKVNGSSISALRVTINGAEVKLQTQIEGENLLLLSESELTGQLRIDFAMTNWYLVNLYNQAQIPAVPFTYQMDIGKDGGEK